MARPESPLNCPPRRRALAETLRAVRAAAGITYAEMAAKIDVSQATLKRIASGNGGVPKWKKVQTYAGLCFYASNTERREAVFAATGDLLSLWILARQEERGTLGIKPLLPEFVRDHGDLSYALYALYERVGAPSLRDLQDDAGGPMHLPLTTAARIVSRQTLPVDTEQYKAFLAGCGIAEGNSRYKAWLDAWYKVVRAEGSSTEVLRTRLAQVQAELASLVVTRESAVA
ncbi:helix-turn-helix domain-containing protein [Streptomyces sp. NPDC004059]